MDHTNSDDPDVPDESDETDVEHLGHGCPKDPAGASQVAVVMATAMQTMLARMKENEHTESHVGEFVSLPRYNEADREAAKHVFGRVIHMMCHDIQEQAEEADGPFDLEAAMESAMVTGFYFGGVMTELMASDYINLGALEHQQNR